MATLYRNLFWNDIQWLKRAEKQSELGNLDEAIAACDKAIKKSEDNLAYSPWCKKAYLLIQQERLYDAVSCFQKALNINSHLDAVWHDQARILFQINRISEAIKSYDQALKLKPNSDILWIEKGDLLVQKNQARLAADSYQRALEINPDDKRVWYSRGDSGASRLGDKYIYSE
ncbi:tetratricopeptide repeat protein [Sodalinema gerasimenkoae]|uniref:tetratricopeptide repeat protein n=1 Tax=Sodalinema gerasimenkoae TaxID=2862348 RepID=UPI001356DB89|nr:tetratricopeptide repeat protein [Sodalinema gerasimenkoae]